MIATCSVVITVLALTLAVTSAKDSAAQGAAPAVKRPFLKVGKTYIFTFAPMMDLRYKVMEEPHDTWIRVESVKKDDPFKGWFNLDHVMTIAEDVATKPGDLEVPSR
jgi:hypothetical protein